MPTSTEASAATPIEFTMPRSVMGRWSSVYETVARAAWMASSAGAVITVPAYVSGAAASVGEARAALDQRQDPLLQEQRVDRLDEVVVSARVASLALEAVAGRPGEQHQRQRRRPGLAAQQPDQLDAGEGGHDVVD